MIRIAGAVILLLLGGCASMQPALHVVGVYEGVPVAGSADANAKEVSVKITDNSRPMVLALSAYDKTRWNVEVGSGVQIRKVVIGGYHTQSVTGLEPGTPIEIYTYEPSPCDNCFQSSKYFVFYEAPPIDLLREKTGLKVTTFQGRYSGSEFSIFPGMKKYEAR